MTWSKRNPFAALALQIALNSMVCAILLLLSFTQDARVGGVLYDVSMWALIPLTGGFSAYLAVKIGLHHYLAWIAPPALQTAIQLLLTAVLPASPGMPMVTILVSVFGAAAGEERRRRAARNGKGKKRPERS